jgi:hypothetical protein
VNGKYSVYTTPELKAELALLNTELLKVPGKKKTNVGTFALADAVVDVRKQLTENDGT